MTSYYLPTVLISSVGLTNNLARLLAACNSVSYLLFSLIGIPNVERWGRRKMMMYAAAGQFFCYTIITICIRYNEDTSLSPATNQQWAKGSIAFFFLYYVFFGIGWQGVPWVRSHCPIRFVLLTPQSYIPQKSTQWPCAPKVPHWEQQQTGSPTPNTIPCVPVLTTHRIFNFMVVEITPPGIETLHWRFYIIWCVFNFAFIPIVYFLYPETAGRTLEDLDRYFAGDAPLLVFKDKEAVASKRPQRFVEGEKEEIRRHSSVVAADVAAARRRVEGKVGEGAEFKDEV